MGNDREATGVRGGGASNNVMNVQQPIVNICQILVGALERRKMISRRDLIKGGAMAAVVAAVPSSVTLAEPTPRQHKSSARTFWPAGIRMVVSISMQMEGGAQPASGVESPMPRIDSKYPDLPASKWYDYGYKEGLPRLLEVFDRRKIKVTSHMVGAAVDMHPGAWQKRLFSVGTRHPDTGKHGPRNSP